MVATPTVTDTSAPSTRAISLYAGHGTPATLTSHPALVTAKRKFPAVVMI